MSNTKQVIVVRKDLRNTKGEKIRTGKIVAQACHASMGALLSLFRRFKREDDGTLLTLEYGANCYLSDWLDGSFTKAAVAVNSEAELLAIYESIPDDIPKVLITDNGLTEFGGVKTNTCMCVGPYDSEELDKYTGHLNLL